MLMFLDKLNNYFTQTMPIISSPVSLIYQLFSDGTVMAVKTLQQITLSEILHSFL